MDAISTLKTATIGLRANRMRSILTTLGVIIGVTTVISMMSIIEGINNYTYKLFGSIGSNVIYIQKYKWQLFVGVSSRRNRSRWREIMRRPDLTIDDARAIAKLPSVELAVAYRPVPDIKLKRGTNILDQSNLQGATPGIVSISGYSLESGRPFVEQDELFRRRVCIIGKYQVENLFEPGENPIGQTIQIGNQKFTVVGVLAERGQLLGNNLDNIVIVPLSTAEKYLIRPRTRFSSLWGSLSIMAKVAPGYTVEEAMKQIRALLRERRGLRFDEEDNFGLNTQAMLLSAYKQLTSGIFMAMIGIASLALLVGGIGIMNIMLVSVTERTREIGLRMAVGAKRREILAQFLLEAIILTSIGGLIGVALGFLLGKLVARLTPLPSHTPLWSVFLGLGFSIAVGLFFGIYPARKAARLNPIEALRYE